MDAYEATKVVLQRIQALDPENASKIMGFLLIQEDHSEKEMIRLAFGSEALLHSVILKARKELGLSAKSPSTPPSPAPFGVSVTFSRQNSSSSASSRLLGGGLNRPPPLSVASQSSPSWASPNSSGFQSPDTLMSHAPFYGGGGEVDLMDELQLQDRLSFLNDGWGSTGGFLQHRRSCSVSDICLGSDDPSGGLGWKPCLYFARGYCKNGTNCRFLHSPAGEVVSDSKFEMIEQRQELLRSKCMSFLLQQQHLQAQSPRAVAAALMMSNGMHKLNRTCDFGMNELSNACSRQIYLTFPADSSFKEEDVSTYFSNFGPVQDVRIPYQQKRMFGFVTFVYAETVKMILAKGNPHFVCDSRVLVKPYKEKGKVPEKFRKQTEQMEMGEFTGCGSPTGLESLDPYDLPLGSRMAYNTQDMLWRRKLEEQAIELQSRRLMNLHFLDATRSNNHLTLNHLTPSPDNGSAPNDKENQSSNAKDENGHHCKKSHNEENNNLAESLGHNLPDSPFASPKADTTPFGSCHLQCRSPSGQGTIGM